MAGQKWQNRMTKNGFQEKNSSSLSKGELRGKNERKFSNQSGDITQASIYLTNYRSCCS